MRMFGEPCKSISESIATALATIALAAVCITHVPSNPEMLMGWAWVIPVVSALISAAGGIYASKQAKKKSSSEKNLEGLTAEGIRNLLQMGGPLMQQGKGALDQYSSFLKPLVSGSRTQMMQHLAPELTAMGESNRAAMQGAANLGPRGGASSDFLSQLPFRNNAAVSNLMFGARNSAAGQMGALGTNMMNLGMNAMSGGRSGAMNLLDFNAARNARADAYGGEVSGAIYNLLNSGYDSYNRYKQTGGASSGWSGTDDAKLKSQANQMNSTFGYGGF